MTMLQRLWAVLVRSYKGYAVLALMHVLYKLVTLIRKVQSDTRLLGHLPGYPRDIAATEILANVHRIHDWRRETLLPFAGEDMVKTPSPKMELACISHDSVKFLLKDEFKSFTKLPPGDPLFEMLQDFIGSKGIFVLRHGHSPETKSDDTMWLNQRKTAAKIFTKNRFQNIMGKVFRTKADRVIDVLSTKKEVDMQRVFFSFTMDSIQSIFFSRQVDTSNGHIDPYAKAFDDAHHYMMKFVFNNIAIMSISKALLPFPFCTVGSWTNGNLLRNILLRTDPAGRQFVKNCKFLDQETRKFVRQAKKDPELDNRDDLLAKFLNSPGGDELTEKELRDLILNFIIAGRDTTACTLTWLFYELTQHLDIQKLLIEEIDRVLQGRNPELEDLVPDKMPLLTGCLYEALRLHPPVPEDVKVCAQDVVFKGTLIPKDTHMIFSPYTMGRDPARYMDPLEFDPFRWIPFEKPSPFEFPVFQAGNRFCLGQDMAVFETKYLTSRLLQRFSFSLRPGEKVTYSFMITMSLCNNEEKTSNNLWLIPKQRIQ